MIRLIANENMKIYRRPRTWALFALQIIVILLPLFFIQIEDSSGDWRANLVQENKDFEQTLNDTSFLDKEAKASIAEEIQINNYRLEHDIPPMASMWSVVSEWMFVIQFATLFVVIIASDIVASEFTWGTIKLLLIRPVSRMQILLSKYGAVLLFAALMLTLSFLASCLIGGLVHGFGGVADVYLSVNDGVVKESPMAAHVLNAYLLKSVSLLMISTFAFMVSAVFRSSSLAIALAILFLFMGQPIVMMLSKYEWVKYLLFANTDLTPYLDGGSPLPGMTVGFSVAVLAAYFVLFHFVSWAVFTKRDVRV